MKKYLCFAHNNVEEGVGSCFSMCMWMGICVGGDHLFFDASFVKAVVFWTHLLFLEKKSAIFLIGGFRLSIGHIAL